MIKRHLEIHLKSAAQKYPILTITGPRQSGKTTLARQVFPDYSYISLEDPALRFELETDPKDFLSRHNNQIIFDEAQKVPELFSHLQVLVDENPSNGRFVLTGSEQFLLNERISQSLAGRTALFKLLPFSLSELNNEEPHNYWARGNLIRRSGSPSKNLFETLYNGFYPRVHDKKLDPSRWYREYFETYVTRDVRQLSNVGDLKSFESFLRLLAGRSGQILNLSSLGSDAGVTHTTAKRWLSILEASYIVCTLPPFHRNFGKRIIKSPKVYFLDSGLLCSLLNLQSPNDIAIHPLRGQIFETFAYSEIFKSFSHAGKQAPLYFWQDSQNNEIDVLIDRGAGLLGVEIKSGTTLNKDFFTNLHAWQKISHSTPQETTLIYGGSDYLEPQGTQVVPWYGIS